MEDKREGYGILTWTDGRCYKGFWKKGKQHGIGLLVDQIGNEYHGEWRNGRQMRSDQI